MDQHQFCNKKLQTSLCITFILLLINLPVFSQEGQSLLYTHFKKYPDSTIRQYSPGVHYYITSWDDRQPGNLTVARKLGEKTAVARISDEAEYNSVKYAGLAEPANNLWKITSSAQEQSTKAGREQQYILSALNSGELLTLLENLTDKVSVISVDRPSHSVLISADGKTVMEKLLPAKEVIFIDIWEKAHTETGIIGYNRSFHGINAVDYSIAGANGKNITIGVKEQKMEGGDLDLYKRVVSSPIAAATISNHATVISSIIGGAGNSFYNGRGIANGCRFFPSSFDNLFADDASVLTANTVSVQNHSYGTVIQQFYGAEAVSYDAQGWQNKNLLSVFSAGNQGTSAAAAGPYANITGYANLTGNFKMAKNIITVGAIDNKGSIPAESSAGPLYDGRLAPQIIALGPNGTSDAAAIVSGTIAVMQQVFADSNGLQLPPSSLVKAALYNSAADVHTPGVDYKTGFGLLNSLEAIKTLQLKKYDGSSLIQGQQWIKNINVPPGTAELKITLAWTDSTGQVNNSKALINDLDLEVTETGSGTVYRPWVLSTAAHIDSLSKQPVRKRDSLNTAEQVTIQMPVAGNYQVKVTGTAVVNSPLPFHIAFDTATLNTFHFTSPLHASDVNRQENENLEIRWKTFVADTNQTGSLFISYNNGADWQLIKAGHKIYTNLYRWPIRDTASTARLKMETAFGNYLSENFIISDVLRPSVDFLCTDSFGLSWDKHVYADSYKIYTLTDSPYLKHILTVTDTFTIMKRNLYPHLVYAVEPVLNNNLPASRSIAFDITLQGVKCFYKTFYYNLLDGNHLDLILELSSPAYVDSVHYELVSAGGLLLRTVAGVKTNSATSLYHQVATDLTQGTSYWRARIKLKTGAVIYTEIISVLSSGKKYILFYPNPSSRHSPLNWVLQQGTPASSRLQLFDITGRLLRDYIELPPVIEVNGLAPGIIIYKLSGANGKFIETGKLVLQ